MGHSQIHGVAYFVGLYRCEDHTLCVNIETTSTMGGDGLYVHVGNTQCVCLQSWEFVGPNRSVYSAIAFCLVSESIADVNSMTSKCLYNIASAHHNDVIAIIANVIMGLTFGINKKTNVIVRKHNLECQYRSFTKSPSLLLIQQTKVRNIPLRS